MFALGMVLPFVFGLLLNNYNWPVIIWDILQMGGLGGLIVFGLIYRFTKPKKDTSDN